LNVDTQEYLTLLEKTGGLLFFDIETSNLRADYGGVLVASFKPYGQKPFSLSVKQIGHDSLVVREAKKILEDAKVWVSYYGKGFDVPFLNTRLLKNGQMPIDKRPHLDMYFKLKYSTLTSRKSLSHLLLWLGTPEQKMSVSADTWATIGSDIKKSMPKMIARCESDCAGLEDLYKQTRQVIVDITR
jgi:hypothetical protein